MYRKPGAIGVLKGVLSGPYTGGSRRLDATRLPRATRQRLADALAGRSEPSAIVYERTSDLTGRFPAFWGLVVALVSFATLFAMGFGDLRSARALQGSDFVPLYLGATSLFAASLLVLLRRRGLATGHELAPGRYLLPLDLVEVPVADRHGRQVLVVTPLGDARDAAVDARGGRRELVLFFEGGREARFAVRSEAAGELALVRLEHTQNLLEQLTYVGELGAAFAHDPFFDLRVDGSWDTAQSLGAAAPASFTRGLLHGPAAWAAVTASAIAFALGGLAARNGLSDRALWLRAVSQGTPEAFDAYLEHGRTHRDDATALRAHLLRAKEERARQERAKEEESAKEEAPPAVVRSEHDCLEAFQARASRSHPEVRAIVEELVERARVTNDPTVVVAFTRSLDAPSDAPQLGLDAREIQLVRTFEMIFSSTCPANALRFERARERGLHGGLDVSYVVTYPPASRWERTDERGDKVVLHGIAITFDVMLRGTSPNTRASFRLTMPPPAEPITKLRDRSVFWLSPDESFERTVYEAMTARAFDRLYDELYGLFLDGDPIVPIPE